MKLTSPTTLLLTLMALLPLSQQQGILEGVVTFLYNSQQLYQQGPEDSIRLLPEYDFIVVGAGTAGCAVANRLSENPNWNVLLIEAGDRENFIMDFPLLANYLQFSAANWKYKTMPNPDRYCMGMDNGQCNWPRGKVMGGSSVLNYMIYTRGNRRDYDQWAQMGNPGWSYQEVLPYFKKLENFTIEDYQDPEYHATDGPLSVVYPPYHTKLSEAIIKANEQMGIPYVDYNGKVQTGVSYIQATLKDGLRHSSNKAYIIPVRHRKNLHVQKLSTVTKVLIDPITKQTLGVQFVKDNKFYTVKASKEVILSGGAINSPQLLMLSGIGPKKHLRSLNITVLQNSRVGFNLMDHIAVGGLTFTMDEDLGVKFDTAFEHDVLNEYLNNYRGPISIPGGCEVLTFYDFNDPKNPDGYPDIELLYIAGSIVSDALLRKDFAIRDDIYNEVYKEIENNHTFMIMPMLLRPKSKGRLMLKSADYRSKPLIYPNYFANEEDMRTIVKGVKLAVKVTEQQALKSMGVKLHQKPIPNCANHVFASDDYFACMARYFTFTIYHLSGTAKMGPASDKRAVVDHRLRVHGIKGLRVIDASIMPEVPAGHTNAPVYMIAEKGSDMIKEDWGFFNQI